jgi:hypothetical protein
MGGPCRRLPGLAGEELKLRSWWKLQAAKLVRLERKNLKLLRAWLSVVFNTLIDCYFLKWNNATFRYHSEEIMWPAVDRASFLTLNQWGKGATSQLRVTRYKLRVTSYELRVTSYELRVTNYELQVTSYKLQVTSYELRVMNYKLRITDYKLWVMSRGGHRKCFFGSANC